MLAVTGGHEPRDGVLAVTGMSPVIRWCARSNRHEPRDGVLAVTGGHEPRDGVLAVTGMSPVMVCSQ